MAAGKPEREQPGTRIAFDDSARVQPVAIGARAVLAAQVWRLVGQPRPEPPWPADVDLRAGREMPSDVSIVPALVNVFDLRKPEMKEMPVVPPEMRPPARLTTSAATEQRQV